MLGKNLFIDARVGLNKILFPTYFNGGNQQSLTDNATGIIYGNNPTEVIRNRDRFQANATAQYYVDRALGGRHEFRFGFDHSHAVDAEPDAPRRRRAARPTTARRHRGRRTSTLYATPLIDRVGAERHGALRPGQLQREAPDADRRPALRAARRLPAGAGQPGRASFFPNLPRSFARGARRRAVAHGRAAHQRDLRRHRRRQDGASRRRTAATTTCCRPAAAASATSTRTRHYSEQYNWNDVNGDLKFQTGEQTGTPVITVGHDDDDRSELQPPVHRRMSASASTAS